MNSRNKIREKIIQQTLSNFRTEKKELNKDNKNKKIFTSLGIQSLKKEKDTKINLKDSKKESEPIFSMNDNEETRRARTYHNWRSKKKIKLNRHEYNNLKIMVRKIITTLTSIHH